MIRYSFLGLIGFTVGLGLTSNFAIAQDDGGNEGVAIPDAETLGDTGLVQGDERFLRENREPGAFVGGATGEGVGNLRGQTGAAAGQANRRNAGGFNQFGNLNQLNRMFQQTQRNQRQNLRLPLSLGFTSPAVSTSPTVVSNRIQTRLARIPKVRQMGNVQVQMDGRTAVLQGLVPSEDDRQLVARMLMLEPGVSDVRNELVVQTPPPPIPPASIQPADSAP